MKQHDYLDIVPAQHTGKEIEAEASAQLENELEAKLFYDVVKHRLLNVNNWHQLAGIISAKFQVVNAKGEEVTRSTEKGDYLRVDIPGPGSKEGEGYDWVLVEELKEMSDNNNQSIGFRVRPTKNPLGNKNEIAHFYADEATSNFIVIREKEKITAWVIDRNIMPNDEVESLADKIRDTTIGIGAIGIFSRIQWKGLAEGLVKKG